MKKSKKIELTWDQNEKLITLALEERNPFEIIKKDNLMVIVSFHSIWFNGFYEPLARTSKVDANVRL